MVHYEKKPSNFRCSVVSVSGIIWSHMKEMSDNPFTRNSTVWRKVFYGVPFDDIICSVLRKILSKRGWHLRLQNSPYFSTRVGLNVTRKGSGMSVKITSGKKRDCFAVYWHLVREPLNSLLSGMLGLTSTHYNYYCSLWWSMVPHKLDYDIT